MRQTSNGWAGVFLPSQRAGPVPPRRAQTRDLTGGAQPGAQRMLKRQHPLKLQSVHVSAAELPDHRAAAFFRLFAFSNSPHKCVFFFFVFFFYAQRNLEPVHTSLDNFATVKLCTLVLLFCPQATVLLDHWNRGRLKPESRAGFSSDSGFSGCLWIWLRLFPLLTSELSACLCKYCKHNNVNAERSDS